MSKCIICGREIKWDEDKEVCSFTCFVRKEEANTADKTKFNSKLMFSSEDMTWATPQAFFDRLNDEFKFNLDPCCVKATAKCDTYFTPETNGLEQNWGGGHTVFMNPPYGREIGEWLKKAYIESKKPNTVVACLIPARTDTKYWHDFCMRATEIRFVKGRLKFGDSKNSAPFPSAVIIFDSNSHIEHELKAVAY